MGPRSRAWSPRSQRSVLKQWELEDQIPRLELQICLCEKRIAKTEEICTAATDAAARGHYHPRDLGEELAVIENEKREIAAFQKRITSLKSEIRALANPTPSQRAHRRKHQAHLARLAKERLAVDRLAQAALEKLRDLLQRRNELTAEIKEEAAAIDMASTFDEGRVEKLLDVLPDDLVRESERWFAWFIGNQKKRTEIRAAEAAFTLPETLVSAHAYRAGDKMRIVAKENSRASGPLDSAPAGTNERAPQTAREWANVLP